MKSVLDSTVENLETIIISRSNDKDVVLLSLKDYNSWMETMYFMRSE
jgi:antitoxin YefM